MAKSKKTEKTEKPGWSRRDFIRGAGLAITTPLVVGEGLSIVAAPQPNLWGPGKVALTLRINGRNHQLNVEPRVTLLDALRDYLDITGAKRVCDRATCGACTVMINHKPVYACSVLAIEVQGEEITTVEGLTQGDQLHPVQAAFVQNDAQQCGFCTPGFVMACTAFLNKNSNPTLADVEKGMGGNLCRCGTYAGIKQAVLEAARSLRGRKTAERGMD
ncbi:MAG: (2Fe-2S)-binding protein [Acidobacteria bacterium]|nr:(2Fe-2S)-binding protein [Acidobacteriota bacterium]MBI3657359.1 (2Fe-2S)-binding protein [Acidobacteriota bacterium]